MMNTESQSGLKKKRNQLKETIRQRSFSVGSTKILASGKQSHFYFNMKTTMSQPEALHLIGDMILDKMIDLPCDFVAGMEMGAVPIVNAVAMKSFMNGCPIPLIWVRKTPKSHGTQDLIEGHSEAELAGKTVIVLEDVTTTGGSSLKAVNAIRKTGANIDTIITIVDRLEGAAANLEAEKIRLIPIFTAADFR